MSYQKKALQEPDVDGIIRDFEWFEDGEEVVFAVDGEVNGYYRRVRGEGLRPARYRVYMADRSGDFREVGTRRTEDGAMMLQKLHFVA